MQRFRTLFILPLLAVIIAASAFPQAFQAQLTGVVHDTSSAVVPKARVVATNQATGTNYETESNDQGLYRLPALPPAQYKISVSLKGFKTFEQGPITLQ